MVGPMTEHAPLPRATSQGRPTRRRAAGRPEEVSVRISLRISLLLVAFAVCVVPLGAQSTTGNISGGVVDESKAVLPGAAVEGRNLDTGIVRTQTTRPDG